MKRICTISIILLILLKPWNTYSQEEGIATALGVALAGLETIKTIGEVREQAEFKASEHILSKYDNIKKFNLRASLFSGTDWNNLKKTSIMPFEVYEYDIKDKADGDYDLIITKRYILICYGYPGFINEYGLKYELAYWELIDKDKWFNRMKKYVRLSSNTNLDIEKTLKQGNITHKGVTETDSRISKLAIEFYELDKDSYLVSDYSDDFKYIYKDRSLVMFNKISNRLCTIDPQTIIHISKFLKEPVGININ